MPPGCLNGGQPATWTQACEQRHPLSKWSLSTYGGQVWYEAPGRGGNDSGAALCSHKSTLHGGARGLQSQAPSHSPGGPVDVPTPTPHTVPVALGVPHPLEQGCPTLGLPWATVEEKDLSWGHIDDTLTLMMADEVKTEQTKQRSGNHFHHVLRQFTRLFWAVRKVALGHILTWMAQAAQACSR